MKKTKYYKKFITTSTIAILIGVLFSPSILAVTRTISDNKDTLYTKIWNTEGNIWECSGDNIQSAINDLSNQGGTVWVGSDVTLSSPLYLKEKVQLNFLNNIVTLSSDTEFIRVTDCKWASVRNVCIIPSTYHTKSFILLYIQPGSVWSDQIRYNIFENIRIKETSSYTQQHNWTAIHIKMDGDSDASLNTFRDIYIYGCRNGILFESNDGGAYANGNRFENIVIDRFINGIWFDDCDANSFNSNNFVNVKIKTVGSTEGDHSTGYNEPCYGVRNINGSSNVFDHCYVIDWNKAYDPQICWWIGPNAKCTRLCLHESARWRYDDILNKGSNTIIHMGGCNFPNIYTASYPPSSLGNNRTVIWVDTDNDKTYFCFFWEGARRTLELT